MPDYRAYIMGSDNHFYSSTVVKADNNEHAVEVAMSLVDGHDIELWHLDRKIAVCRTKNRRQTEVNKPLIVCDVG